MALVICRTRCIQHVITSAICKCWLKLRRSSTYWACMLKPVLLYGSSWPTKRLSCAVLYLCVRDGFDAFEVRSSMVWCQQQMVLNDSMSIWSTAFCQTHPAVLWLTYWLPLSSIWCLIATAGIGYDLPVVHYISRVVDDVKCIVVTRVCVCLSVCPWPHACTVAWARM